MDRKTRCGLASVTVLAALVLATENAAAAGDARRGAQVFQACMACHSVKPGEHLTGPSLANVWNHRAGTANKFSRYSDALKRADIEWGEATLDKWLSDPVQLIPGTSMTFPGLKKSKDRQDVIAYLRSVSEGKAPSAEPRRGGMMM